MNDATHPIGHDPLLRWWSGIPPASPATPLPGADRFFHPDSKQNDRAYVEKPDDVLAQAQRIITAEGLGHLVTVELRDYRDLQGEAVHDKVASVGMFKHAGLATSLLIPPPFLAYGSLCAAFEAGVRGFIKFWHRDVVLIRFGWRSHLLLTWCDLYGSSLPLLVREISLLLVVY